LFSWYHPAGNGTWRQCFSKLASRKHLDFPGASSSWLWIFSTITSMSTKKPLRNWAFRLRQGYGATSEVERLPNFELLLTANGISAGIAA
jgi:hypothetical protein